MKIHAAQLDLVSADIRAVSASIKGTTTEAIKKNSVSTLIAQGEEDGTDLSHFTIPDNDFTWIDMDDFVELDWILPSEPNPDTKILPLVFAPRITYFRQTDIGGLIAGDPDRTSPFGLEPTHLCIMSQDDDPRRVQTQLIKRRLEQLDAQIEENVRLVGEKELRAVRDDGEHPEIRAEFEAFDKHTGALNDKKAFMEEMLHYMATTTPNSTQGEEDSELSEDEAIYDEDAAEREREPRRHSGTEFASDFKNRFVVHNMQLKWNNMLRNIILRYSHQVSQRRGFVYYLSRPAVKFILDIVEDQAKAKNSKSSPGETDRSSTRPRTKGHRSEKSQNIDHRIQQILQDGRKFVNGGQSTSDGDDVPTVSMEDLTCGIGEDFAPQSSYHVRLIAPQIQLQSDKNKKHVVLVTGKGMELKVVEVMEKARMSDTVSGLVQRRFSISMDSTQFFVAHQKWFSGSMLNMYTGNTYGAPGGSSWPPWVPMEVMHDFQSDPYGFRRVVQKTSAMLRYDKFNNLRLKYDDDVNSEGTDGASPESSENRMDNLWIEFPQARALCNSSQYYAIYVIVLDLLMYSEPLEKTRSERLEKIMLASDFSDLRGTPEMVVRLQERIRQLEDIKTHFQIHSEYLDQRGWEDRLLLERDLAACEDELFFMMKAITTSQRKYETTAQSNALLKWSIAAKEIVWHLVRDTTEPLVELQLRDVEYDRTDNSDGSHENVLQVGKILGLNLLPDAIYPEMVAPYLEGDRQANGELGNQKMIQVYWHMLEAIAGIPVMEYFEVNLFPMRIQLEREVGKKIFEYIFPGMDGDKSDSNSSGADSPDKRQNVDEAVPPDDYVPRSASSVSGRETISGFDTRPGSLELRLHPTLTSVAKTTDASPQKTKALSVHSGEGHVFRLFSSKAARKQVSTESLRLNQTPRPGIISRSTTFTSTQSESKKSSRFALRSGKNAEQASDDLSKMMARASEYMTFAYIRMPSVVLCLSYKGKGDRNIEDVHDFVFRLPTIEYRNKTWSNLDLALALKQRVVKALISHTGAIIGNKFSKHRPNTAQQTKLRELATNSVLLATPVLGSNNHSGENSDDSLSMYGSSPVDFSRSPPRSLRSSLRGSQTSIPTSTPATMPQRSTSRASRASSGASSSRRSSLRPGLPMGTDVPRPLTQRRGSNLLPSFLTSTTPTMPTSTPQPTSTGLGIDFRPSSRGSSLLRPMSRGSSMLDTDQRRATPATGNGTGTPGFLKGKLNALTHRLRDREGSGASTNDSGSVHEQQQQQQQPESEDVEERDKEIERDQGKGLEIPGQMQRRLTWTGKLKSGDR
jgi:hypothetical protein